MTYTDEQLADLVRRYNANCKRVRDAGVAFYQAHDELKKAVICQQRDFDMAAARAAFAAAEVAHSEHEAAGQEQARLVHCLREGGMDELVRASK